MASNDDDRRQWRKQGGVVGAAASKTRVPPKARSGCWVPQPGRSGSHFKSFSSHYILNPRKPQPPQQQLHSRFSKIMLQHQRKSPPGWA